MSLHYFIHARLIPYSRFKSMNPVGKLLRNWSNLVIRYISVFTEAVLPLLPALDLQVNVVDEITTESWLIIDHLHLDGIVPVKEIVYIYSSTFCKRESQKQNSWFWRSSYEFKGVLFWTHSESEEVPALFRSIFSSLVASESNPVYVLSAVHSSMVSWDGKKP